MLGKLLRSAVFIKIVKWAAPKIWEQIKKRRAGRR